MTEWNRKQKFVSFLCGSLEITAGLFLTNINDTVLQVVGTVFVLVGIYYYMKGLQ